MNKLIDGIWWTFPQEMPEEEKAAYVEYVQGRHASWLPTLKQVAFTPDGDEVEIKYIFHEVPFERIRRITGYLVGTVDRWNDAKKAELNDRVKHDAV